MRREKRLALALKGARRGGTTERPPAIGFEIDFGAPFYGGYNGSPYSAYVGDCVLRRAGGSSTAGSSGLTVDSRLYQASPL